jgi:hypothetical protein
MFVKAVLAGVGVTWDPWPSGYELYGDREAVPVLIQLLGNSNPLVRALAADCLLNVEPLPKEAIPALLDEWQKCKADYRGSVYDEGVRYGNAIHAANRINDAIWAIDREAAIKAAIPREAPETVADGAEK